MVKKSKKQHRASATPEDLPGSRSSLEVIRIVEDLDTQTHYLEVRFADLQGLERTILLPRSIQHKPGRVYETLVDAGAALPAKPSAAEAVISKVLEKGSQVYGAVTGRTGWYEGCFVLPERTFGSHPRDLRHWERGTKTADVSGSAGSLEVWRDGLVSGCAASSYLTFAIALAFTGPLLRPLGHEEGFFFNLAGESSTGKTLAGRAARSVIGRADQTGIFTPDAKDRGLEELAFRHNDLFLCLDDLGRMKGSKSTIRDTLRKAAYTLAGGRGMIRSKVVQVELPNLTWAAVGLTSWENPLNEFQRAEGEQIRLIDLPIPPRSEGGIFDLNDSTDGDAFIRRKRAAKEIEAIIADNYGLAIVAFIEHLVEAGPRAIQKAKEVIKTFVADAREDGDSLLDRLAEKFGLVLAAATLAVDYRVAPWTREQAVEAVKKAYYEALTVMTTPEEATAAFLAKLARRSTNRKRFPKVKPGKAFPSNLRTTAYGLRRTLAGVGQVVAVRRRSFLKLAGSKNRQEAIVVVLQKQKALVAGKDGKATRQIMVKGFAPKTRRPRFYVVKRSALTGVVKKRP